MYRTGPVIVCLILMSWLCQPAVGTVDDDNQLSVLYVGPSLTQADLDRAVRYAGEHAERQRELRKERPAAFEEFLKGHFSDVRIIKTTDYTPDMSDDYDVTIFDARPPVIEGENPYGNQQPLRLPLDFDRPAIFIGSVGPFTLGRFGPGLKIDHL